MENISKMEMANALFNKPYIKTEKKFFGDNGNYRLNLCYSQDREFAALQLQQFSGFEYHTVGGIRFVEGDEAHKLLAVFVK